MAVAKIIRNKDNTITVKVGREVETISVEFKDKGTVFTEIRVILASKGAVISDPKIIEVLWNL